jgi:hypothetical protein
MKSCYLGYNAVQLHAAYFMLVSYLPHSSTLKIEATCSSETSVDFQQTTRRYIPEDTTPQLKYLFSVFYPKGREGTRYRSWLRHYATNRKVMGSLPDEVIWKY